MKNQTVVKRYARALLELGIADGQYVQYGRELKDLAEALGRAGETARALTSPAFPEGVRRKMLDQVLNRTSLSPLVNNFVRLLMDKGRLVELPDIAAAYNALADEQQGLVQATITSAGTLTKAQVESIRAALGVFSKRQVNLTLKEDPAIIGGLVAQMGDLIIDGSVRTQIDKLSGILGVL